MTDPYSRIDDDPIVYEVATPTPIAVGAELDDEPSDDREGTGSAVVLLAVVGLSVAAVAIAHRLSDS